MDPDFYAEAADNLRKERRERGEHPITGLPVFDGSFYASDAPGWWVRGPQAWANDYWKHQTTTPPFKRNARRYGR